MNRFLILFMTYILVFFMIKIADAKPIYRLYLQRDDDHFYTDSSSERDMAISNGYVYEGVAFDLEDMQRPGTEAFYRLYGQKDHFYTRSEIEVKNETQLFGRTNGASGYKMEAILGYIFNSSINSGLVPLYRLVNTNTNHHFYTISLEERDRISGHGYRYEGIAGYTSLPSSEWKTAAPEVHVDFCLSPSSNFTVFDKFDRGICRELSYGAALATIGAAVSGVPPQLVIDIARKKENEIGSFAKTMACMSDPVQMAQTPVLISICHCHNKGDIDDILKRPDRVIQYLRSKC